MRTYLCWFVLTGVVVFAGNAGAEDGRKIFESLHCSTCHKADAGKFNPSLKEIAQAYKGSETRLGSYLGGQAEPVVRPQKGEMMKRYIEKTTALPDEQRKALADFILSHHE